MEEGSRVAGAVFLVLVFVFGWVFGQAFPWRRLRHPVARSSGDGGIEVVMHDVAFVETRGSGKPESVELIGRVFESDGDRVTVHVEERTGGANSLADEMRRIGSAGSMVCVIRPGVRGWKRKDQVEVPREPVRMGGLKGQGAEDGS